MTGHRFKRQPSNGCSSCRQDFGSVSAFDAHRVGKPGLDWPEHEKGRRCLDVVELAALGWTRDKLNRWRRPIDERAVLRLRETRRATETTSVRGQAA